MSSQSLLSSEAFARAAAFLQKSRPLDQALFAFHFKQGSSEPVRTALQAYQNPDGGFFGLEADIGFPASTVLSTCHALHMLRQAGTPTEHPIVQQTLDFLLNTYDEKLEAWPIIPLHDNSQPHAPWWHCSDTFADNWGRYQDNPRPNVLACLLSFPCAKTEKLIARVSAATLARLRGVTGEMEMHGVVCYVELERAPGLSSELKQELARLIPLWIAIGVERDPAKWNGYGLRPLDVAQTADSPWRSVLKNEVEAHLNFLIQNQTADGCWDPHWNWGDFFPEAWPAAKQKWQAVLTLANLRTLRSYGRISGA